MKTVTTFITESQSGIFTSSTSTDDSAIVNQIKDLLQARSEEELSKFLEFYDQLSKVSNSKFRSSILHLILSQSEMNNCSRDVETIFSLPKSRSTSSVRTTESTLDSVFRKINLNNNNAIYQSESNLKIASLRKTVSTSSTATNDTQQDEGENSSLEDIIQEIIYVLTGNCGKYLKKDMTGEFKLDIKAQRLGMQEAGMFIRLAETG